MAIVTVLLVTEGGSKGASTNSANVKMSYSLYGMHVVQSEEQKERAKLRAEVRDLLSAEDFDGIDKLARELRKSEDFTPMGIPKIASVYGSLDLSEGASDADWERLLGKLRWWVKARPDSITARVALAGDLVSYAWKARGSGFADTITEEGGRLFEARLKQAVQVLRDAASLQETCPRYWSVYLQAALGLGFTKTQYDQVFRQAIQSNRTYAIYYKSKAIYLLPRWYGEPGDSEKFVRNSCDRIGGEEGDLLYARVAWQVDCTHMGNIFSDSSFSWDRVEKGFSVMRKRYPNSLSVKSEEAQLAGRAGKKEQARKLFKELGAQVDLSVWETQKEFERFAIWVEMP